MIRRFTAIVLLFVATVVLSAAAAHVHLDSPGMGIDDCAFCTVAFHSIELNSPSDGTIVLVDLGFVIAAGCAALLFPPRFDLHLRGPPAVS